ncbi:MAG: selenocysteine-specific translation elongation factor [Candidatus Promineifilaceae bacterium]
MDRVHHVIGTAGHVDHGKSTLVEALTGIDPDRLKEEKAREMTIDLGFAWLTLGDDEIGIVDVPGHRDFIENMLAGVGSIDLALFVIAADEGVMPQTEEHLAILDLLHVKDGIIALTKIDLIEDPDWLELVTLEVADVMAGSILENAPIIPVSAQTGAGLDLLRATLSSHLAAHEPHPDHGHPRLPIDRVFSLAGFGTIVTGTLTGGSFRIGDQVEIAPGKLRARIRGLQAYKKKLEIARPGTRVAVNLAGIERAQIQRGQVIAAPGTVTETILFDASYRHLPGNADPLKHNREVKLFVGAAEVLARTRILGTEALNPGEEGWLQFALSEPVALSRGDRFIVRRPSPAQTIGGGIVLDPHPGRRHRRFRPEVIERLQTLSIGDPAEVLEMTLARMQPSTRAELLATAALDRTVGAETLDTLLQQGSVVEMGGQLLTSVGWRSLLDRALSLLDDFHKANPLRLGMPREELRSRLQTSPALFNVLCDTAVRESTLAEAGTLLRRPSHRILLTPEQQKRIELELQAITRAGANTPSVKETQRALGTDLFVALIDLGRLQQISADVLYEQEQLVGITAQICDFLEVHGEIDAAGARDLLQTSRKYAIAILEYLDDRRITKRVGDVRVLR